MIVGLPVLSNWSCETETETVAVHSGRSFGMESPMGPLHPVIVFSLIKTRVWPSIISIQFGPRLPSDPTELLRLRHLHRGLAVSDLLNYSLLSGSVLWL